MPDFSSLLAVNPVQLPDPFEMLQRGMSLKALTQRTQLGEAELSEIQRRRKVDEALSAALPGVMQAGWSPEAIRAAIERNPESAGGLLEAFDKRRKSDADFAKTGAEIRAKDQESLSKEQERKLKVADYLGNEAGWLADHPNLNADMIGKYFKKVGGSDLQDVLTAAPFQDWTNVEASRDYLRQIQNTMFDTKDRIAARETERSHRANESHQSATLSETARNNARIARDAALDRQQRWGIAGMNDQRQRDLNDITREGNNTKRVQDIEMKLGDDYRTQSKGWQETAGAIGKINQALDSATTNPGSALSAGTAFMKILDPNSVVRESELGMALNASGWFDRVQNVMQTMQSGKVMTPTQVDNLRAAANELYTRAAESQRAVDAAFTKRTKDYGGDPARVLMELGQNNPAAAAGSKASSGSSLKFAPQGAGYDLVYTPGKR